MIHPQGQLAHDVELERLREEQPDSSRAEPNELISLSLAFYRLKR